MKRDLLRLFLIGVMSIFTLGMSAQTMPDYLCFTANTDGSTVAFDLIGSSVAYSFQTSTDGVTWDSYVLETVVTLANKGDKVYFRYADEGVAGAFSGGISIYYQFTMTGSIAASGNVMSLIDNTCTATTVPRYCFIYLFKDCTSLTTAPELPATVLGDYCYREMFQGCTNLESAPELPATTLARYCYYNMFNGCTNLKSAPELPATKLSSSASYCYKNMFDGCTKLNNISVAFSTFSSCTNSWVNDVSTSGTFSCPSSLKTTASGTSKNPTDWTVKNTYDLEITDAGWASMCVNLPLQIPEGVEGLEVYYASAVSGTQITLTKIDAGTTIAAKTAVLVKGAKGTVSFPIMSEAGTSYTNNLFVGTSVDKPFNAEKNGAVYVLSKVNSGKPQFQNYVGTTLGAHKIWLPVSAVGGSNAKALNFVFDNEATGINSVNENENEDENIYNLNGVRVNEGYKGIVIKNGKKVYNK